MNYRLVNAWVAVVIASLFLFSPQANAGVLDDAQDLRDQLSPINNALGPLIDRAVARGDSAIASRLKQLQQILQETLATADAILTRHVADIDDRTKNRLSQLAKLVDSSIGQLNGVLNEKIPIVDSDLQKRIRQIQIDYGQIVEAINWLNIDPVINLGPEGMTIYKEIGENTSLFISGVGFQKGNLLPQAWAELNGKKVALQLGAHTPSGAQFLLKNNLILTSGTAHYQLMLSIPRGFKSTMLQPVLPNSVNLRPPVDLSVPLHVVVLGPYSISATMRASGERWDRISAGSEYGTDPQINCSKGDKPSGLTICAKPQGDYQVDGTIPNGGLTVSGSDGRGEHSETWVGNCFAIYCSAEHADRGGYSKAIGVAVHLRKRVPEPNCGSDSGDIALVYDNTVQLRLHPETAIGSRCGEAGLSVVPTVKTEVVIHRPYGQKDIVKVMDAKVPVVLDDDPIRLVVDDNGILEARLTQTATWHPAPATISKRSK